MGHGGTRGRAPMTRSRSRAGTGHRCLRRRAELSAGAGLSPPSPGSPVLGRCSWGQVAHSTRLLPGSQLAQSLLHPQRELQIPAIHSTHPTGVESLGPTQNPRPPSPGDIRAWPHHPAPVLCCSTEHCWGKGLQLQTLLSPASPCAGFVSSVFQLYPPVWSSPKAGLSTEPDHGQDEGGGQMVNPLHGGHAGRAQVMLAERGWLCPGCVGHCR